MLSRLTYGTFANYSPRGTSDLSQRSKKICGRIKKGHKPLIVKMTDFFDDESCEVLLPFFDDSFLVPIPRSAPIPKGAVWPSHVIASEIVEQGYGTVILPCLKRIYAVQKSAFAAAADRPTVEQHYDSISCDKELVSPQKITLVDDVLTQGTTSVACALRVAEVYPDAEIRVFAIVRTQGFVENIEKLRDPSVGVIHYYKSGKVFREP